MLLHRTGSHHDRPPGVAGLPVLGARGHRLGRARGILPGATPGSPSWLVVATGLLGLREALVPLPLASFSAGAVRVPWGRDQVRHAPRPADVHLLRPDDEAVLTAYYVDGVGRDGMAQAA
jgi:hypothetical protein